MSNYLSLAELKNSAELIGFSFADYDAEQAILAAEAGIEEYCGRRFYTSAGTVRWYSADNWHVEIDDTISVSTLATDYDGDGVYEQTWTSTDYLLEPLNAAADGKPYERLSPHPASSLRWPCWPASIQVTGTFGWPTTPPQVKEATTIMATRLLRRAREAPFGVVGLGLEGAAVRVPRVDPDVCFLLDNLVRGQGVLAA